MTYLSKLARVFGTRSLAKGVLVLGLMASSAVLEMVGIGVIFPFLQLLANPDSALSKPWLKRIYDLSSARDVDSFLIYIGVALVIFVIFKGLFTVAASYVTQRVIQNERAHLSTRLVAGYISAPWELHIQRNSSVMLRNVVKSIEGAFSDFIVPLLANLADIFLVIAVCIVLVVVQPTVTLLVIALLLVTTVPFYGLFKEKAGRWGRSAHENEASMLRWLNEGLGSLKELKVRGRESFVVAGFSREAFAKARNYMLLQTVIVGPRAVIEIAMMGAMVLVIVVLKVQGESLQNAVPTLGLFAIATFRLVPAVSRLANGFVTMRYGAAALDQIYDDVVTRQAAAAVIKAPSDDGGKLPFKKEIALTNVSFRYPQREAPAISSVSLVIQRGQSLAFVGPSGSGKTTLVDLILGILTPSNGAITVDGQPIADNLRSWQRNIGYVPQSIFLSDDSFRNNIAFAVSEPEVDDERIREVVEAVGLTDIVQALPDGLATKVGERGIALSGGQRQRLGIARALYGRSDLLVLDEATSALDVISEQRIAQVLERLKGSVTILVIAHRLSTIRWCDQLVFLKNGEIADVGTYGDLNARNVEFRRFVEASESHAAA